jgi:hypothetical protein
VSSSLSKDQILDALNRPEVSTEDVHVPELGGTVRVREMTGALRNRLEATYATIKSGGDSKALDAVTAQLVATCVIDEGGRPMLTTSDVKRMLAARPRAVFRLRDAIVRISATDEDDVEALAEVFDDAQSAPSTTG